MLRPAVVLLCLVTCIWSAEAADDTAPPVKDGNRLAYLDECNPWYPHKDFPKLITPQWVGEEGVEAVIVLAIDDMRDPAKYEAYLRPILNRLKQIDGRAPVSIMTCDVKPDDPQLQSWLGEGLNIECHTIDHPCPILQGGDFDKAKSTYDRCVDLMGKIPGNKPVAFRTPCCDSLNTVSPRFFAEIFNSTTNDGNFLQIDSSVMTFFTSEDESLPKELVLDANGNERFWKYLPKNNKYGGNTHDNFVNYIKNYPYPYVINNSCWEIPCIAPSDWSAQHLHGINNPVTIEDWKAAIDLTVHKQGCFSLVFHPHGWIKPEQVVEMIDHAVAKHGKKVKFLNFKEVAERLKNSLAKDADRYRWNEVRVVDVDNDRFLDVIDGGYGVAAFSSIPEKYLRAASMKLWESNGWRTCKFPVNLMDFFNHAPGVKRRPVKFFPVGTEMTLAVFDPDPTNPQWDNIDIDHQPTVWALDKNEWRAEPIGPHGGLSELKIDWGHDGALWRDFDGDGRTDLLLFHNQLNAEWDEDRGDYLGEDVAEVWSFNVTKSLWESREWLVPISPSRHSLRSLCFVDINQDARLDLLIADATASEIWLQSTDQKGWTDEFPVSASEKLRPITKTTTRNFGNGDVTYEANNGFFIHDRHFCWINEDTATLPDLMYRVSFDDVLAEHKKANGDSVEVQQQDADSKSQISNLKSADPNTKYDPVSIGAAVVDITPDYPVRLTGYGNRLKESEGVAVKIHARALVIGRSPTSELAAERLNRSGTFPPAASTPSSGLPATFSPDLGGEGTLDTQPLAILITVDNCGVPIEITEAVYDRIAARHNIPRERFAISSTHSHSAPWLRGFAPNIFSEIPDDHAAHLAQYEKELTDKLVDVVDKAIARQRPGHLSYGFGEAGFAMNRRALTNGRWSGFGEVPDGPTDKRVPVLAAHDVEGKLIAVLANYACHCTTETGEFNQISGDWAGFAADMLEADHPGAVALIAIGCGADANPSPRGTHEQAKVHGRTIADEVNRVLNSEPTALAAGVAQTDRTNL